MSTLIVSEYELDALPTSTPVRKSGGLSGEWLVVRGKDAGSPDSGFYRGD